MTSNTMVITQWNVAMQGLHFVTCLTKSLLFLSGGKMPIFGTKKYDPKVTSKYSLKELLGK